MRDHSNYLYLYRELLNKPIWTNSTSDQRCVLIAILLRANHSPGQWEWKGEKYTVQPGQFITSLQKLAESAGKGVSIQNVRSSIKRFKTLGFLTEKATKTGRLITIINWSSYQPSRQTTQQSNQQTGNKGPTPNNNDKNVIKEKRVQPDPLESQKRTIPEGGFSSEEISESSRAKIEQNLITVANELSKGKFPEVYSFIQKQRNYRMHPGAILHALNRCHVTIPKKEWNPWAYCQSILDEENGNYNERDAISGRR